MEELIINIKKFENNKATGPDRIPKEFIKHAPTNILKIILQLLNLNIEKGFVASWCLDFISPIHKEGSLEYPRKLHRPNHHEYFIEIIMCHSK